MMNNNNNVNNSYLNFDQLMSLQPPSKENPFANTRVADLFREQARKTPDAIAVEMGGERMTYKELDQRSDLLSSALVETGVMPNDIVAMNLSKNVFQAVGILGVTKSGGAFLPMDPSWPLERRQYIVKDANCRVAIIQGLFKGEYDGWFDGRFMVVDDPMWDDLLQQAQSDEAVLGEQPTFSNPNDIAYVIFTSGSTGKPKGVMVKHLGLMNYQWSLMSLNLKDKGWRCALSLNYYFDFYYYDFFSTICFEAGTIVYYENGLALDGMTQDDNIQCLSTIPSLVAALSSIPDSVEMILVGGEALTGAAIDAVKKSSAKLVSAYGPTETSNLVCARTVLDSTNIPSLGTFFPNVQTYVTCPDSLALKEFGEWGELLIGGDQVGLGYLNRPELTAEKFISNPWGAGTLYRTGDLVRFGADGQLEIGGRIDFQIKFNGQRMEAGEIENALMSIDGVDEAIVLHRKDLDGPDALCAYVKPSSAVLDGGANLKDNLVLPKYMFPTAFIGIDSWPRNGNDKIDRKSLPKPVVTKTVALAGDESNWEARNEVDNQLRKIFADVLKLDLSNVASIDSDFFEIGGDSLGSMKLVRAIQKDLDVKLPIAKVMKYRTVAALSDEISKCSGSDLSMPPVVASHAVDSNATELVYPAHSGQSYILKLSHDYGAAKSTAYSCPMALWVDGDIHLDCLEQAMIGMKKRQAVMRTGFMRDPYSSNQWLQVIKPCNNQLSHTFLYGLEEVETEEQALALYREDCATDFGAYALTTGNLVRSRLVHVQSTNRHLLLVQIHHIIFDGLSHQLFWHDFSTLYAKAVSEKSGVSDEVVSSCLEVPQLEPMPLQLIDLTQWQLDTSAHPEMKRQRQYWRRQLREGRLPLLAFPEDKPRPNERTWNGWSIPLVIQPDVGRRLVQLGKEEKCTPFQVILALWSLVLCRHTGQEEVVVGCAFGGREQDAGLTNVVGFMVNYLAMRVEVPKDTSSGSIRRYLRSTRETVTNGILNGTLPYNQIVNECLPSLNYESNRPQVFQTMLSMAGTDGWANHIDCSQFASAGADITPIAQCTWDRCKSDVRIRAHQLSNGGFKGDIEFNSDVYSHDRIKALSGSLVELATSFALAADGDSVWSIPMKTYREPESSQLPRQKSSVSGKPSRRPSFLTRRTSSLKMDCDSAFDEARRQSLICIGGKRNSIIAEAA